MQQTAFGTTGRTVTRMGLGLAALGRPGYINLGHGADLGHETAVDHLRAQAFAVLDTAWSHGVRYFDAARSYGRAEEFLGSWLQARQIAPAEVTVASKWGYTYTAGWQVDAAQHEVKDHSLPVLRRQWHETQSCLGPFLRLYQIHSATFASGVLTDSAVLGALAQLKSAELAIGLSLSGADQDRVLRAAMAVEIDGLPLFDAVQATWNLLEPSAGPALAEAASAGMAVVVKEALANGRLTSRNERADDAAALALLRAQARRLGVTVDGFALAAVLAQPWVHVVLSGATTAGQLASNLQALTVTWDDEAAAAAAGVAQPATAYWQTRSALAWN